MEKNYTPGPWRWEVNGVAKSLALVGGKPKYDKYVMDFKRWGMNGAQPRFNGARGTSDGDKYNIMQAATSFSSVVKGREHHEHWFRDINHPDAQLIAAAPELLEALTQAPIVSQYNNAEDFISAFEIWRDKYKLPAIAKATSSTKQ